MEQFVGILVLLLGCSAILLLIYSGIRDAVAEWCEETAQELAENLYHEWVRNTHYRVIQRLEIKDETKKEVRS